MTEGSFTSREEIKEFLTNRPPGPRSIYNIYHFEWVLRTIAAKSPIGRNKLGEEIQVGGGSIRSLLKLIKKLNLIDSTKSGLILNEKGDTTVARFKQEIPYDPIMMDVPDDVSLAEKNTILIVRGVHGNLKSGLEQTTAALRIDASGASTILFQNDKFSMPGMMDDLEITNPKFIQELRKLLDIKSNDVIIIGMGSTEEKAIMGAWAAAYSLLNL